MANILTGTVTKRNLYKLSQEICVYNDGVDGTQLRDDLVYVLVLIWDNLACKKRPCTHQIPTQFGSWCGYAASESNEFLWKSRIKAEEGAFINAKRENGTWKLTFSGIHPHDILGYESRLVFLFAAYADDIQGVEKLEHLRHVVNKLEDWLEGARSDSRIKDPSQAQITRVNKLKDQLLSLI